jgi:hypothetical protein
MPALPTAFVRNARKILKQAKPIKNAKATTDPCEIPFGFLNIYNLGEKR